MRARAKFKATLALLVAACVSAPSWAGFFTVTPVRIFMSPRDRAVAVTITNDGDEELVMQADVFTWAQKPSGEDDLVLSEDLVLSPPILKLAPKARQVVRLAMVSVPRADRQLTYRMIVREVPEARQGDKDLKLQVALAFSLPVFITPPSAKRQLECNAEKLGPDTLRISCENRGTAYAMPREFALTSASGQRIAARESGGYILPGVKRTFDLKKADGGNFPGGAFKLAVTLDDGSAQAYDVTVTE